MHIHEHREVAERWLREKMSDHFCTICGASDWAVGAIIDCHTDDLSDELSRGQPALVDMVCQSCAAVLLFDVPRMTERLSHEAIESA